MEQEEIRELEPKYTGNERHLTEGEAAGIKAELERQGGDDGPTGGYYVPVGLYPPVRNV